ncbi:adenylate cyclase [Gordonia amarae]|uniref:Adenylate cyclase n=1 Tax=Gordonia amarae NBRC 15530 TaxID=1075090 RepID=G7GUZ0_9ACTN|nr:adenylate/guanylate cyclase domain-containing protein [Gordonia amarae]MCS3877086.1 adenylate cyclase [Gordonia amarae]GAB07415.1 adenylate cyclase [Gordonia amarae NBRC 15530]
MSSERAVPDSRLAARRAADRLRRKETEPIEDVDTQRLLVPPPLYNPAPKYTRDELVAVLGVLPEDAGKIWNAFGFAKYDTPEKIFSEADMEAFRLFVGRDSCLSMRSQIAAARAIGQMTTRLADWQAEQIAELAANPRFNLPLTDAIEALSHLQTLIWRRHLDLNLRQDIEQSTDVEVDTVVGFVDIVGYTSLSRRIALYELEDLLEGFEENVHEVVAAHGGQVIKTLGDAVMFTVPSAPEAAVIGTSLQALADDDILPAIRVGLARGHVLSRLGDVFGEPVNIASRLCGSAYPGTVLVDEILAADLKEADLKADNTDAFRIRSIPPLSVRGYRRLKAFNVEPAKPRKSRRRKHSDDETE